MRVLISVVVALVAAMLTLSPANAQARALEAERAAGLVGDSADGYLSIVQGGAPALQKQVDDINAGRRAEYQRIAKEQGTTPEAVGAIFGEQLYQRTPSGQSFRDANGNWIKKP